MPGPYDGRGNVGCMLYAFSLTTTLSPEWMGKDGVSVVVMIPNLFMPQQFLIQGICPLMYRALRERETLFYEGNT